MALVDDAVRRASLSADNTFLQVFVSGKAYYNQNAATSVMQENINGKNVLRNISNVDLSSVSVGFSDGYVENLLSIDSNDHIDNILIRNSSSKTGMAAYKAFIESNSSLVNLNAISAGNVYVMDTNVMSGYLSYVGYALMAEMNGVPVDLDYSTLVSNFNAAYGTSYVTTGLLMQIQVSEGTPTANTLF